jgi:GNAT superfamily N-acetyltransferase
VAEVTYRIERLASHHQRSTFDCGHDLLNRFLTQTASQRIRKRLAQTFVHTDLSHPEAILGYYSLNTTHLDLAQTGPIKGLPQSIEVGGVLIGRLAVAQEMQRQGIGERLLVDAFDRTLAISAQVGIFAVVVSAIDENAVRFYTKFGFTPIIGDLHRLYYPLKDYESTQATTTT